MRTIAALLIAAVAAMAVPASNAAAHCELPCGIYHDEMYFSMIREDIETIEKSMKMIEALSAEEETDYNQLVRWVVNKEEHAEKLMHVVEQYFLHQRIKPVDESGGEAHDDYLATLEVLHHMLVEAMKCTQTTDLKHVENLKKLTDRFEKMYFQK